LDSKYPFRRKIFVPHRRPPSPCSTRRILMRPNILRQGIYTADAVHGPDTAPRAPLVSVRGVEPRLCGLPQPFVRLCQANSLNIACPLISERHGQGNRPSARSTTLRRQSEEPITPRLSRSSGDTSLTIWQLRHLRQTPQVILNEGLLAPEQHTRSFQLKKKGPGSLLQLDPLTDRYATICLGKVVTERRAMRNFFTRRRSSSGRSRTVHSGTSRGGTRRGSSGGTVEMALGALVVVALVLVLLRLVGLI
jgi:hypothetical protein